MEYYHSKINHKSLIISNLHHLFLFLLLLVFLPYKVSAFCSITIGNEVFLDSLENGGTAKDSIPSVKTPYSVGLRVGLNRSRLEINNPYAIDENSGSVGTYINIFGNYNIESTSFGIQPELTLARYRSNNTLYQVGFLQGRVDYTIFALDFNLLGTYYYPLSLNGLGVSLEAGGALSASLNSFGSVVAPNQNFGNAYDVSADEQFNTLNYAVLLGIVPSYNFRKVQFQASIRYRYGLNDINTRAVRLNRYLSGQDKNMYMRDWIFQLGISVPIYVKQKKDTSLDEIEP